jgi:hypothetical protein
MLNNNNNNNKNSNNNSKIKEEKETKIADIHERGREMLPSHDQQDGINILDMLKSNLITFLLLV